MKINNLFDGKKYEEHSQVQRGFGSSLISGLNLKGDEKILDLGCGNALTTRELAGLVPEGKVVGVDWSISMLETAKTHKTGNMELILLDINEMSFDNEFDVVFSNSTLHWVPDHEKLLENVRMALKHGGFMRLQFAADGNCPNFIEILKNAVELPEFNECFKNFTWPWNMPKLKDYEKLVRKTGFLNSRVWGEDINHHFPDENALVGWIDQPGIIPFVAVLPKDIKELFRNFVIESMKDKTKQADGTYLEIFERINVYAEK